MEAVIANTEQRLVALGYNGFPKQVEDCQSRLHNKKVKYEIVVHAEANALLIAGSGAAGGTVYLYGPRPICGRCAGILIQGGIKRAVAIRPPPCDETRAEPVHDPSQMNWAESGRLALQMFKEAEVEFEPVHNNLAVEQTFIDLMNWAVSQEDLAYEAAINRSYMSKLEKGASYPGLEIIAKATVLEVEPAELLKVPEAKVVPRA
jgi:deoxycytidylate deaminase